MNKSAQSLATSMGKNSKHVLLIPVDIPVICVNVYEGEGTLMPHELIHKKEIEQTKLC